MRLIQIHETTGKDGVLHINIPLESPDTEYEVVVVVQPKKGASEAPTAHDLGWPAGYFEATFGSIKDETFMRQPQGELPPPVELD